LVELLDDPVAAAHVDDVLDRGVDVLGGGGDDEAVAGGADRFASRRPVRQ